MWHPVQKGWFTNPITMLLYVTICLYYTINNHHCNYMFNMFISTINHTLATTKMVNVAIFFGPQIKGPHPLGVNGPIHRFQLPFRGFVGAGDGSGHSERLWDAGQNRS